MTHKCPKNGCDVEMSQHLLTCLPHWYSIPRPVREEVNHAWTAFQRAERNDRQVFRLAHIRYLMARKALKECLKGAA